MRVSSQASVKTKRQESDKDVNVTEEVIGWIERLIRQKLSAQSVVDYLKIENVSYLMKRYTRWSTQIKLQVENGFSTYELCPKSIENGMDIVIVEARLRIGSI